MKATHKLVEEMTQRQKSNALLKALTNICDADNGTIKKPYEPASTIIDGKPLIRRYHAGEDIRYNDGYFVVEADQSCIYVDITVRAMRDLGLNKTPIDSDFYQF